jgi:hypothetical protein
VSSASHPSGQVDPHHKREIESLQPCWQVEHGGAPGLRTEDREALVQGRVPPSYVALGIQQLAHAGTYILFFGLAALAAGTVMAVLTLIGGDWLIGALIAGFFGAFGTGMGWMFRRGARLSPSEYPAAYDRPAHAVVGRLQRKWSSGGREGTVGAIFIQLEQLVFTVDSPVLWQRLRVGGCYRCWYLPIAVHDRTGALLWVEPWAEPGPVT